MFRKHRALILTILACGLISALAGATWVWATGRRDIPPLAVIGLALAAAGTTLLVDMSAERRRRRAALPATAAHRHRKPRARAR